MRGSNDTVSLMLMVWRFFFMLLFASCRTNMSGSSYLHLLSNTTNMSTTTVACDPSFPIFRAVSIIVKSAPPEHMERKWSTSPRLRMNRSLLLLWARNSDCLHWTSFYNWNTTSIEPPVLLLWGSCSFVPDFYTHQRRSGILFHTTCSDKKCGASKFLHMFQERSNKLGVRVPLYLPHKLSLLTPRMTWWSSLLI